MSKFEPQLVTTGHYSNDLLNENFTELEEVIETLLSRDGTSPNAMEANLDMDSHRIINLPSALSANEPVTYGQLLSLANVSAFTGTVIEKIVATEDQQVFNLSVIAYTPGVDNLTVYRNGSYIDPSQYVETDADTVTFLYEANENDEYIFVVNQRAVSADTIPSSSVTHTIPNSTTTNVDEYLDNRYIVSVKDYGAVGNGIVNDTSAINQALAIGGRIYFPAGTYLCSGLVINTQNTVIVGDRLVTLSNTGISTDQPILEIAANDVTIDGFFIHNYNTSLTQPVINIDCTSERRGITFKNNWITNDAACIAINVEDLIYDFTFTNNVVESPLNPDTDNSRGLYFGTTSTGTTSTKRIIIENNKFRYGSYGCDFVGTGSPNGPIFIRDNEFLGQDTTALHLYHCKRWEATGNHFVNVTAQARPNNDNGVVFLDTLSPVTLTTTGKFCNNHFVNCVGNAIYAEECIGIEISGNEFLSVSQRTSDTYSYDWTIGATTATVTSDGGAAILITGGCQRVNIHDNYIQQARMGVKLDRSVGAHPEYEVTNISIRDNVITRCAEAGILIKEKVTVVRISGNDIFCNGGFGDSAAIVVDRQNTDSTNYADYIIVSNNDTTPDPSLTNNQARGYYEKYNVAHTLKMNDNTWVTSGILSAIAANSISGRIVDNFISSGAISLTTPNSSLLMYGNVGAAVPSYVPLASATTAQLTSLSSDINTRDKYVGKSVWNTTTNVLVISVGSAASSHWYTAAGVDTHTPV